MTCNASTQAYLRQWSFVSLGIVCDVSNPRDHTATTTPVERTQIVSPGRRAVMIPDVNCVKQTKRVDDDSRAHRFTTLLDFSGE